MNINVNIGLPWILSIVFMVLKLCGVIDWPWLWIAAPIWSIALLAFVIGAIEGYLEFKRKK